MADVSLEYKTLREQVVITIKNMIFTGTIKAGKRINENQLATQLNISRGPVREALRQLEQERIVTYSQNKGCTVTTLSAEEMEEIYLIRSTLESLAVKACGGAYSPESIAKMEESLESMAMAAAEGDLGAVIEQDQVFHEEIVAFPGKKHMHALWNSTNGANAATFLTVEGAGMLKIGAVPKNHYDLLDTIKSGNPEEICRHLDEHYLGVPDYLRKH